MICDGQTVRWIIFVWLLIVLAFPCVVHQVTQLATLDRDPWPDFSCARIYITLEYWTIGLLHYQLKRGYYMGPIILIYTTVIGVYFGFATDTHTIHHDFTGLLFLLVPLYTWQIVGLAYVIDSISYTLHEPFGLDNVVVGNYVIILALLTGVTILELGVHCYQRTIRVPDTHLSPEDIPLFSPIAGFNTQQRIS
jgi:hypothetical protein